MKKNILNILCFLFVATFGFSCSQNESDFGDIVKDNKPAVPVLLTGTGVFTFAGNPTFPLSIASGNIAVTLSIPASSNRTIKEIKTIIAGGPATPANVISATSVKFNSAPIPVNGTEYKFSTTLAEVKAKYPSLNTVPAVLPAPPAPPTYRIISFLFLVVLDDGTEIVTVPFDCRLIP